MLWINGQLSTLPTMRDLLLPSLASLVMPMALMTRFAPEITAAPAAHAAGGAAPDAGANGTAAVEAAYAGQQQGQLLPVQPRNRGSLVLATGVGALLAVPVFRQLTGLPPFLGMLSGLGVMWLLTDALHYGEDRRYPTVSQVGSCGSRLMPCSLLGHLHLLWATFSGRQWMGVLQTCGRHGS